MIFFVTGETSIMITSSPSGILQSTNCTVPANDNKCIITYNAAADTFGIATLSAVNYLYSMPSITVMHGMC